MTCWLMAYSFLQLAIVNCYMLFAICNMPINNNFHIWELGEVMAIFKKKVLSPKELVEPVKTSEGVTKDINDADIIAAFNGPMSHIYVKGSSNWQEEPEYNRLIEIAKIFRVALKAGHFMPEDLTKNFSRLINSIDLILMRLSTSGPYWVYTGLDQVGPGQYLPKLMPLGDYLTDPKYVDAINRIEKMNNQKRSGDIILIFKDFTNDISENRFTTGSACKSWHGSLNPSDSYVPLILAYPGGNKKEIDEIMKDVTACPNSQCEGNWNTTDIIKEIIKRQYQ